MDERKLSKLQKEYREFFLNKMKLYGINSPDHLSRARKSLFFTEIKQDWAKYKLKRAQKEQREKEEKRAGEIEPSSNSTESSVYSTEPPVYKKREESITTKLDNERQQPSEIHSKAPHKQIIRSEPNIEQTDDLRILYTPNDYFIQGDDYLYPVVKMPERNAGLKLPREGRSNQKGFKEKDFYNQIKNRITNLETTDNVHMTIPKYNRPYEPDIVLFDKNLNLYIDIEIDEPYDGYYRYPTHFIDIEQNEKQDNIRDLFFTESGWVVIRFTEKQVHCQPEACIEFIQEVLNSLYNRDFSATVKCEIESQWDYNQCVHWQKIFYREKYLGIQRFQKASTLKEVQIDIEEVERIERVIQRTKKVVPTTSSSSIAIDENAHKYFHLNDKTGNAEFISVTTLIERFFPFDLKRYIEKKALDENRLEEDVLVEYLMIRDEAIDKGSYLHTQIDSYLKGDIYDDNSKEFRMFLKFLDEQIKDRNLIYTDSNSEKIIFSKKHNIAGTVDCLLKKTNEDEYVMLDWKRSKRLIIDGRPKKYGFGYALSELRHLDNSSYNRYCLQQNIYKYILEKEHRLRISSMKLVVLHEEYENYFIVNVPNMRREVSIILNSLKYKI